MLDEIEYFTEYELKSAHIPIEHSDNHECAKIEAQALVATIWIDRLEALQKVRA
ncbi:hypothetical protein D3C83_199420 [compost metagenome]